MAAKTIENTVELSAQELGLTPLVFDKPFLNIDYLDSSDRLINLSIKLSSNYIDNLVKKAEDSFSDNLYERTLFPVILVQANIEGEKNGKLNGIIRPKIITTLNTGYKRPIKGHMPEFFFYITNTEKGNFEGKAMRTYSNASNEGISCGIKQVFLNEIREIDNLFELKIKSSEFCNIYHRR